ncbi:MAG: ABC transporter permease [Candidatus Acidiferrum sp.]
MGLLWYDFRYGWRMLRNSPGFAALTVLTLALGIAANTTVFSWIRAVLLSPLPGTHAGGRLVAVESNERSGEGHNISILDYRDYRDHSKSLEGITVTWDLLPFLVGPLDHAERVLGETVASDYFDVLGVRPELGRLFATREFGDQAGSYPAVVIGDRFWRRYFHADAAIVGRAMRVNGHELTVIGVTAPEFEGSIRGVNADLWVPMTMGPALGVIDLGCLTERGCRPWQSFARLKQGATLAQANGEMQALALQLERTYPETNRHMGVKLLPESQANAGVQAFLGAPLRILMATSLLVLAISCVNVSNLLLARSATRQREIAIRMAMGAGPGRVVRQLLTETLLLAALAAAASLPLSLWLMNTLKYIMPDLGLAFRLDITMNWQVAGFTMLVCVAAALLAGITPAWHAILGRLNETLKESGRSSTAGSHTHRLRDLFVVAEVGLAMVGLVGAGLFTRSFHNARALNPGFDPKNVVLWRAYLASESSEQQQIEVFERLRERLEQLPGVTAASFADLIPLGFGLGPTWSLTIEGYTPAPGEEMDMPRALVSRGYFATLRMPLAEGRDFDARDDETGAPVMIVNQAFERRYYEGRSAMGRRIRFGGKWRTIVGVARDTKYYYLTEPRRPFFYAPIPQVGLPPQGVGVAFFARTTSKDPMSVVTALRGLAAEVDAAILVVHPMTLVTYTEGPLFAQRAAALLLSVLGALALMLAATGLYSVMAYAVTQRTHEIGIRIALGAEPFDVLAMIVRRGMLLVLGGVLTGVVVALVTRKVVAGMLTGISPADPGIMVGSTIFLCLVALAASFLPARRATQVDPMRALREE